MFDFNFFELLTLGIFTTEGKFKIILILIDLITSQRIADVKLTMKSSSDVRSMLCLLLKPVVQTSNLYMLCIVKP